MQKDIHKTVNIAIKLNYTEICNLLKGGVAHTELHIADFIPNGILDDIEDSKLKGMQINIRIDEEATKHLQFMKAYLAEKEKHETR